MSRPMNSALRIALLGALVTLAACESDGGSPSDVGASDLGGTDLGVSDAGTSDLGPSDLGAPDAALDAGEDAGEDAGFDAGPADTGAIPFMVVSRAFSEGEMIPLRFECGPPLQGPGENVSPDLTWTRGPNDTQSYAIVVRDVDARVPQYPEGIIHWVIYDIPPNALSLNEGIAAGYQVTAPTGAKQANIQNSGFYGYFGPCSPNSINTYVWTVHAMPTPTVPNVGMGSTESEIAGAIELNSIAQATLSGES